MKYLKISKNCESKKISKKERKNTKSIIKIVRKYKRKEKSSNNLESDQKSFLRRYRI